LTRTALEAAGRRLEDRAEVIARGDWLVLVVADGAGGRPGPVEAAEWVVRRVREETASPRFTFYDPFAWPGLLSTIDREMLDDAAAGEATAVVAAVSPKAVFGASVGDSGAWLVTADRVHDLTARQQRKPFLGTGVAGPVPFGSGAPAGTLLLATDGLLKYTSAEKIAEAAPDADLDAAARRLVDLVRLRSGALQDDVGLILCRPVG
jgi:serine/threonine protein phosphatase PrpC